jgi:hypothetical protein
LTTDARASIADEACPKNRSSIYTFLQSDTSKVGQSPPGRLTQSWRPHVAAVVLLGLKATPPIRTVSIPAKRMQNAALGGLFGAAMRKHTAIHAYCEQFASAIFIQHYS